MRIIGCDLHARQQTLAMLDTTTGEVVNMILKHEGDNVREFYSKLPRPVLVGIEATGSMQWFLNLMEELGIECRVGHPAQIRATEPRKQKHDRRDAIAFRRSGCLRRSYKICGPCCGTRISGCACARESRMHRRPWPWRTVYDGVPRCGAKQANRRSRRCRWRPIPLIDGPSYRRCTRINSSLSERQITQSVRADSAGNDAHTTLHDNL